MIRLSKSCLGDDEKLAVDGVLSREYLGMGTEVEKFESALGAFFDRPVVCVVNGTAALHLALQACGIGRDDEVLVPSLTYVASFQAISAAGAKPVACDVVSETLTLDWQDMERRLTTRTKAVMPVHYTGGVGQLDEVYRFARRHGLRVIEDAAHAFGTIYQDKRVGGSGDIVCFSFDGIKNITSGEGGCIVTDDKNILTKVRDARLLGVERDSENRSMGERTWEFDVVAQGWRYHMSNIMAAIGSAQLDRFSVMANKRQELAMTYNTLLTPHKWCRVMPNDYRLVVPHIYVVRLEGMRDRKSLRTRMLDCGIQTGVHYWPNHRLSLFRDGNQCELSVTDREFTQLLTLPLHPDLTEKDVEQVVSVLSSQVP